MENNLSDNKKCEQHRHLVKVLMRVGSRTIAFLSKIAASLLVSWLASIPLIRIAALERGYNGAYGGEWLVIITIAIFTYYFSSKCTGLLVGRKQG